MPDARAETLAPVLDALLAIVAPAGEADSSVLKVTSFAERLTSSVARVDWLEGGSTRPRCSYFIKVLKCPDAGSRQKLQGRITEEHRALSRLTALFAGDSLLAVVRPVAVLEAHLASITEEVRGETLLQFLPARTRLWSPERDRTEAKRVLELAGQWVRRLQGLPCESPRTLPDDLTAYIDTRLGMLQGARPAFTAEWRRRILQHAHLLQDGLPSRDREHFFAHGDLALGNMIWTGSRLVGLDLAMAQAAPRLYDITRLSLQLDMLALKPFASRSTISDLKNALLAGYGSGAATTDAGFRLLTLLHRVNHLASMVLRPAPLAHSIYNRWVARSHAAWLDSEVRIGLTQ